nr:immunoglobulin heavy chain junction region [Mus musculus]
CAHSGYDAMDYW